MQPMGDTRRHFFLTLGTAEASGLDLGLALREGRITETGYARLITCCRRCDQADRCTAALAKGVRRMAPPDYCLNRDLLAQLQMPQAAIA
ncbi:MAG: hypothetical protein HLUCCA08_15625 [Rhodobacteraceae bacterium HLUCCA08]|nr:MAG: hypothetical protein HLUCCA08_15625 [Rhodobacteraceae bacterium HLUCCA08]